MRCVERGVEGAGGGEKTLLCAHPSPSDPVCNHTQLRWNSSTVFFFFFGRGFPLLRIEGNRIRCFFVHPFLGVKQKCVRRVRGLPLSSSLSLTFSRMETVRSVVFCVVPVRESPLSISFTPLPHLIHKDNKEEDSLSLSLFASHFRLPFACARES